MGSRFTLVFPRVSFLGDYFGYSIRPGCLLYTRRGAGGVFRESMHDATIAETRVPAIALCDRYVGTRAHERGHEGAHVSRKDTTTMPEIVQDQQKRRLRRRDQDERVVYQQS